MPSLIPSVSAVSVCPTCAVPVIVGAPVAGVSAVTFSMVPVAVLSSRVTFISLKKRTGKVSSLSASVSVNVVTVMVFSVSPGAKVRVSDAAVKSSPSTAVPGAVVPTVVV